MTRIRSKSHALSAEDREALRTALLAAILSCGLSDPVRPVFDRLHALLADADVDVHTYQRLPAPHRHSR